uniref:Type IV pilus twitching motility protein PilT n=1 Tax=candidate division WOR-3 bacterium TaxID=2052148 RepID=A0A7C4U7P7_UNCW3
MDELIKMLEELVKMGGSDLHIKSDEYPIFRIDGRLVRMTKYPINTPQFIKDTFFSMMNDIQKNRFKKELELDLSYELKGLSRFRINLFLQKGVIGAAIRAIPIKVKTIKEWGLPDILETISDYNKGFVLVTGPTGSGKSTTLSAMIEYMNRKYKRHIITIEDPIEFIFEDKMCTIEQREIGVDTFSFTEALKRVVRQSPDVIMVGEMRDLETISRALTAAEMGSLVLATLHTTDAAQTVDRIVDIFPPEQQHQVRLQLANTLRAVISQTLLPLATGKGRIPAFEILIVTPAVKSAIREGKVDQIYSLIQSGGKYGMKLLDQSLKELYLRGLVSYEEALAKSSNPVEFESSITRM